MRSGMLRRRYPTPSRPYTRQVLPVLTRQARGSELTQGYSLATLLPPTREWQNWLRLAPARGAGQQLSARRAARPSTATNHARR